MSIKNKQPLRVALYGMDGRSHKTMELYLRGPCRGAAIVVDQFEAELDIIDADHPTAREILQTRRQQTPDRPILLLSLQPLQIEKTLYVKKPVESTKMLEALEKARTIVVAHQSRMLDRNTAPSRAQSFAQPGVNVARPVAEQAEPIAVKRVDATEREKVAKHQSSSELNEGGFLAFLGTVAEIDFNDPEQLLIASYNPKAYYLGSVQSALKVARAKSRVLQLNSSWKPLLLFPASNEVWVDADDKQLKAFAGLALNKSFGAAMSLSAVDGGSTKAEQALDKFQDTDAFLWKLAVLTSKGRFPVSFDIHRPVFLKRWPNFTRLVITPHALRIAALLIQGPRTMLNVAATLNIKPQFVFVFVSACSVLDLVGQAERQVDLMIAPKEVTKTKKEGLLSKILNKLRGPRG